MQIELTEEELDTIQEALQYADADTDAMRFCNVALSLIKKTKAAAARAESERREG